MAAIQNLAATLELLDAYVRIPTISSLINADTIGAVKKFWREQGLALEELYGDGPTSGRVRNPALYAQVAADVEDAPTLLLYGHWDVQPTGELKEWVWQGQPSLPFEPTYFWQGQYVGGIRQVLERFDRGQLGEVLMVGRGTADNKGQHLANILGVLRAKAEGRLGWNVKILLDGEEEIGSPNLLDITRTHRDKLRADLMVGSDGPKSDNRPTVLLGVRGLVALVVRCHNASGRMLHNGNYGNVVPNPVPPLARLLDRMEATVCSMGEDSPAFRHKIDQFFPPDDPDRAHYHKFLYPTFNVNSITSEGATSGQRRTIIPSWAEASLDVRVTPDLAPQLVLEKLTALVEEANHTEPGVNFRLETLSASAASFTAPDREGYNWLMEGVKSFWDEPVRILPLLGGTLPGAVFTEGLGLASYWLPAANSDNRQHDSSEHLILRHFFRQQEFYFALVARPTEELKITH